MAEETGERSLQMGGLDLDRFLAALHDEKMRSQERRGALITRKLTWVTGLFAVGAIRIEPLGDTTVQLLHVLYLVPVVSIVFDLYITGENFGVKRMGAFVRVHLADQWEGRWERWLQGKHDQFSQYALPLSSIVVLAASAAILLGATGDMQQPIWGVGVWTALNLLAIIFIYWLSREVLTHIVWSGRCVEPETSENESVLG